MKFSEVLAISGQQGLFKYLAQGKTGIIIESLMDGKRMQVPSTARVSTLNDISMYTDAEDILLANVFQNMSDKLEGGAAISHKSSADELASAFADYLPNYDRYRVRPSDIKKVFSWYNILQGAGMTQFVEVEESDSEQAEEVEVAE